MADFSIRGLCCCLLLTGPRLAEEQTDMPVTAANGTFTVSPADDSSTALSAALEAARKLVGTDKPKVIALQPGSHFLQEPMILDARDSGLTIQAAGDGDVKLYGGRPVIGWKRDGDRLWSAPLPGVTSGDWDFRMLVVNGPFCKRARFPQEGFLQHLSEWKVPWMSTTGGGWKTKPTEADLTTMKCKPGDPPADLDLRNAELTVYHMWDESVVGIAKRDVATHTLTFSNPAGHPPGAFGVKKYVVWNVREGMTEPGQWYLDRTAGKVVYWPLPGEDMAEAEVIAPTTESIILLQGTKEKPVRDVTLRRLTLSVTNTPLQAGGFGASRFEGALSIAHSQDCTVVNVGGGIYITFCKNIVLRGNFIRDIVDTGGYGASACYLDEQAENCLVEGNLSLRVARPSHNHMAVRDTMRNNVFLCDADAQRTLARSSEYTFEKNVFWAKGKITFTNPEGFAA